MIMTMQNQTKLQDPMISQRVSETLSSLGMRAPCRVTVVTSKGNVTLSGTIQYEHQRHMFAHAIKAVAGVQRVVDQMRVISTGQHWQTNQKR
jgi:osmotically-inducible protein OsmY